MRFVTSTGKPIRIGDLTLTPVAKSLRFNLPWFRGGFIWNRPHSIILESTTGHPRELRIWDVTRLAQMLVFGTGILFAWITRRRSAG